MPETSPFERLILTLRAAADRDARPGLERIASLRGALDTFEADFRARVDADLVRRASLAIGVEADPVPTDGEARNEVVDAAHALLGWLVGPRSESAAAATDSESSSESSAEAIPAPSFQVDAEEGQAVGIPLTAEEISEQLTAARLARMTRPPVSTPGQVRQVLGAILHRAGRPPVVRGDVDVIDEIERLDELTTEDALNRWTKVPKDVQRLLLGYFVARGRALREIIFGDDPARRARLNEILRRLPDYSQRFRPGYVNGMMATHAPESASWREDAERLFDVLSELASGNGRGAPDSAPTNGASPKSKRNVVVAEESDDEDAVDWPLRDRVAEMKIVMYGGSPREDARENLARRLGVGALEWRESDKPRRLESLISSVEARSVDVLLILRLVHHTESNALVAAAKNSQTPYAVVENGYGIGNVREAIEAALS